MRRRLVAASGMATALVTATHALGAPPWSPPRDISAPVPEVNRTSIDFGADGVALIGWSEVSTAPGRPLSEPAARFVALLPDGRVEARARLPDGELALAEVFGRNRTVVLRVRPRVNTDTGTTRIRLVASFGTTAGPLLARSCRVADYRATTASSEPALAASENGEVAVAWFELDPRPAPPRFVEQRYRLRIAVARAGRRFRPRTIGRFLLPIRDAERVALAYGRRGELLVAYGAARRVGFGVRPFLAVRLRPEPGRRFGRQQRVGPRKEFMTLVAAALPSGRMTLAWASQDAGEGSQRPRVVRAALRAPGRRFGPPRCSIPANRVRTRPTMSGWRSRPTARAPPCGPACAGGTGSAVPGADRDCAVRRRVRTCEHPRRQRRTWLGQRRAGRPRAQ